MNFEETVSFLAGPAVSSLDYHKSFLTGIPVFTHASKQPVLDRAFGVIIKYKVDFAISLLKSL